MRQGGGRLVLCGTPIGNLDDMSPRAVTTLRDADLIACEDAKRTRKLLTHFGISAGELVVYNEGNEARRAAHLVKKIATGRTVVLVSDAGMPGLSDPGYRLVTACVEADLPVEVVPGPTAVVSALAVSGLPPARFVFEGFLPRRAGDRARRVEELGGEKRTLVFFCSPHRVKSDAAALLDGLGDRRAALVRELTKLYEEVRRGPLSELIESLEREPPRGEMVLVVEGLRATNREPVPRDQLAARARALMEDGVVRKDALVKVAREAGVPKREVFDALVEDGGDEA
ncbi:MAG: 16S rRNA (cytidine(1402)-2'-O)-methyltransferase [Actinomycetota bacterium]|nr:16S rRNA (cytidine(1402)-2'-O)-methyltransferase [Actinomycetota bacterium]